MKEGSRETFCPSEAAQLSSFKLSLDPILEHQGFTTGK